MSSPVDCLSNPSQMLGWYDADSVSGTTWTDKSGIGNDGTLSGSDYGVFTSNTDSSHELYANGENVVYGTTDSVVTFGPTISGEHTVINLCKYRESGTKQRIIQGESINAAYGHWEGKSGVVYLWNGFVTQFADDEYGTDWVLSSVQRDLYRGNQIDLTDIQSGTPQTFSGSTRFVINTGFAWPEPSDWSCAEVIIINEAIPTDEIICIEDYLISRYNVGAAPTESPTLHPTLSPTEETDSPTISPTVNPTVSPTEDPTSPTENPTLSPTTFSPTLSPTESQINVPTLSPTLYPTVAMFTTLNPTNSPSSSPTSFDIPSVIEDNLIIAISIAVVICLSIGAILGCICKFCCKGNSVQPSEAVHVQVNAQPV